MAIQSTDCGVVTVMICELMNLLPPPNECKGPVVTGSVEDIAELEETLGKAIAIAAKITNTVYDFSTGPQAA